MTLMTVIRCTTTRVLSELASVQYLPDLCHGTPVPHDREHLSYENVVSTCDSTHHDHGSSNRQSSSSLTFTFQQSLARLVSNAS